MVKVRTFIICLLFFINLGCKKNVPLFISEKGNLVFIFDRKNKYIEGFTIHPVYSKYTCNYYFTSSLNESTTKNFQLFGIENNKTYKIEKNNSGKLIFDEEKLILYIEYKVSNVGCSDWIFPYSNENYTYDTFSLKKIGDFKNPQLALIKHEELNKYKLQLKQLDYNNKFVINYNSKTNSENSLIIGWKENELKLNYLNIDTLDLINIKDIRK